MAFSKEKAHERAEKFAAKGQHDKASREYQSIVEHDPKDIRAWLMLADCLVRCGDRPGAVERYLQVAGYYAAQKQPQKALAVYRQVVNLDPRRIDVHQRIAQLNLELGRVQDAVAILEQVGHAQLQAGNTTDAIVTFEMIANAEPTAVSKRLRIAELYSREQNVDKAVEHFREAGNQLLSAGRNSDYVRVAERLVYHSNDDKPTIRTLARVYLQLGDPRRALMKLNSLLHGDPHDREGLELLAETFLALEKPDKAVSVILELVRELRHAPDGAREAVRVARRGLEWAPDNAELNAVVREGGLAQQPRRGFDHEPDLEPHEVMVGGHDLDEELDDEEVVELDDADVIPSDSTPIDVPAQESVPSHVRAGSGRAIAIEEENTVARGRGSMTDSVLEDVQSAPVDLEIDASVDYDKILFEARVYIKYRLFEHAIEHVGELLQAFPDHVGALALRARAYGELGRRQEAADTHVRVARLVAARDPKLAREHMAAALQAVPGHMGAVALQSDLDQGRPVTSRLSALDAVLGEGDSGTFDLIGDESDEIPIERDEHEFAIEVADNEAEAARARPFAVENRFGLSEAQPLPGEDEGAHRREYEQAPTDDLADAIAAARRGFGTDERADKTPLVAFRSRDPNEDDLADLQPEPDTSTGRFPPMPEPRPAARAGSGDGVPFDLEDEDSLQFHPPGRDSPPSPARPATTRPVDPPRSTVRAGQGVRQRFSAEPVVQPPAPRWPDLGDELAEIRFFVDQGLEEDARASLADLERRHPGHPEIAALTGELERGSATSPNSGAKPLVDLAKEDEDEDAYLSAIFGGPAPVAKKKSKAPEIRAATSTVDPGDAATRYDLGVAYKEMGLVDDAIAQFEGAASDPLWEARALVMSGTLRVHRGETDKAIADLMRALDAATNQDELHEAQYELAVVYETIGETDDAREQLAAVPAGYRDRDERLARLGRSR
ncbi:MAG TPA: tetratricopeptide repeat protein [Nannocystaceae bacterium]|nr:tetratricopeptide repeat protein [Nannocystaceae bacterium]